MSRSQKQKRNRIIISGLFFALAAILERTGTLTGYMPLLIYIPVYLFIGYDVIRDAFFGIIHGQILDENFLMTIASVGAFFIGHYEESVMVMLLYQVGDLFEGYAVGRTRQSVTDLMDIRPDYANIEKNGELVQVDPETVNIGDHIVVVAGEKIPLDGKVIEGSASVDTSALTGESVPRSLKTGDEAISGTINLNGVLTIEVSKVFSESTVAQILELVENASDKKAKAENFITRFAKYYTPGVVISAVLLAVLPPLLIPILPFNITASAAWSTWIYRALTFLVISCPCALVISVPLSFFGGIGGASRLGILVKGSNYLEILAESDTIVLDKTGTLTEGVFEVVEIDPIEGVLEKELLEITALAESFSNHPIALSLIKASGNEVDTNRVSDFEDVTGHGIKAKVDGRQVHAGNNRMMDSIGVEYIVPEKVGTIVYVALDGEYIGYIVIADKIKEEARVMAKDLHAQNIRTIMLTGDTKEVGEAVAKELGLDEVHTQLLPADKVDMLEEILDKYSTEKGKVAFVGDGINDAPALMRADVGISMGALGSDAAIEASDVVLMDDDPSKISKAIGISRKTLRIVKQNIIFALGVKFLALLLGAVGLANMWQAVFADVGVSVIAILNAMRALSVKEFE